MIGLPLADQLGKLEFKKSNLEGPKQVFLPKSGFHMNYYERKAVNGQNAVDPTKQPTMQLTKRPTEQPTNHPNN